MSWEIFFKDEVSKQLRSLPKAAQEALLKSIGERLKYHPKDYGKPLSGNLHGYRRLRCGHYRIIYKVDEANIRVTITAVGIRRDIYG